MPEFVAVLFSGGKDSVFATFWALEHGFDVVLVTVRPPEYSMMFHHPNIKQTRLQAKSLGLKQVFVETTEKNWEERLIGIFRRLGVGGIVTGAIASEYQRRRIDRIGEALNIPTYAPLWHKDIGLENNPDNSQLFSEMLEYFEIKVSAVSAEGLGPEFLWENFRTVVDAKVPNIHPFLEGGEGETFVLDAPFFKSRIAVDTLTVKKNWDGQRGVAEIMKARLIKKRNND